ncbi:MAG: sulfatase-like hydrolase/transferase [Aestuariibaculum sp.]
MIKKIRAYIINFLDSTKNIPWLIGLSAGIYPYLKYYNSNFTLINSVRHFVAFALLFLIAPILLSYFIKIAIAKRPRLKKFEMLLFSLVNYSCFVLLAIISVWGLETDILIVGLAIALALAFLLKNHLKKVIVFQLLMALLVAPRLIPNLYNQFLTTDNWLHLPDDILSVKFKETPNIYFIQPDGHVNQKTLENELYKSSSDLYEWLKENHFKVYDGFRSNYPSSVVSNASIFAMKQHYFGETFFPAIEMPRVRTVINGSNSVISILKNNGYANYFLAEDEYFQMDFAKNKYDYQNIAEKEISLFSSGEDVVKDVYKDLENILSTHMESTKPKFFFIEKLLPHHVHFKKSVEDERHDYLIKIKEADIWVKKIVNLINEKDPNAIIILAADHGGWLGIENFDEFHSTTEKLLINSIFSTLCAIKWNGIENSKYDEELKTNVNLFRVLFSALSKNQTYLNHLEENGSYQLRKRKIIGMSAYTVIDEKGNVVSEKLKN